MKTSNNIQVYTFERKLKELKTRQIEEIEKDFTKKMAQLELFNFEKFTNEQPYAGVLENKIFFTYSDHYRGNSGTWMSVNSLNNAHVNMDDRGYIKGVATDLTGYLLLRSCSNIVHNFNNNANVYLPKFRKSKHSDSYHIHCVDLKNKITQEINEIVKSKIDALGARLKEITGMSLFHYLREI